MPANQHFYGSRCQHAQRLLKTLHRDDPEVACIFPRILGVLARRDEEVIHIRPARADRLLLDAADRDDGSVECELSRRGDAAAARDVPTELRARSRARTGSPPTGRRRRPRSMSTSNGSSIFASWSTRIADDRPRDGSSGLAIVSTVTSRTCRLSRTVSADVVAGLRAGRSARAELRRACVTGVASTATITSPASSFAAAGTSGETSSTRAPRGVAVTSYPSSRSATDGRDLLRALHVCRVLAIALCVGLTRRESATAWETKVAPSGRVNGRSCSSRRVLRTKTST